jgi:zinc protease
VDIDLSPLEIVNLIRMKRSLIWSLLITVAIAAQFSCSRRSNQTRPAPSPSPSEQAVIDQVLQRYEQAVGGKDAINAVTTYKMKGTFELAGMTGVVEGWQKEPLKTLTVIEFPRIGKIRKGFDGQTYWVQTPAGIVSDSAPQEIAEMERDAEVFTAGKIKDLYESMKMENKARLNGRDVYVIEGKPVKGPAEKLFFDVENGLLVRWDMARRHPKRGNVFVKVHLEDYREVAGVKVPFYARFGFESFNFIIKLETLEPNIAIDDAIFRKP